MKRLNRQPDHRDKRPSRYGAASLFFALVSAYESLLRHGRLSYTLILLMTLQSASVMAELHPVSQCDEPNTQFSYQLKMRNDVAAKHSTEQDKFSFCIDCIDCSHCFCCPCLTLPLVSLNKHLDPQAQISFTFSTFQISSPYYSLLRPPKAWSFFTNIHTPLIYNLFWLIFELDEVSSLNS